MNETLVTAKAAIAAFFAALGTVLGWKGIMAVAWVVLMALDWITGTAAARKNGEWKSSISRDGAWHKAASLIVIAVAFLADFIMGIMLPHIPVLNIQWPNILAPLVLAWYIVTELGSILENAVKLGAPVPSWIVKIFDATLKMIETVAEEANDNLDAAPKKDSTEPPDNTQQNDA